MTEQERKALRLARECLVFIVHGYHDMLVFDAALFPHHGLCSTLCCWVDRRDYRAYMGYDSNLLNSWMMEWPESTKDEGYPVPCPDDQMYESYSESTRAYYAYDASSLGGKYQGPYGELRLDLARFLIGKIDEVLANEDVS